MGYDGRVGLYVEEANRSWCSSSGANDQRAITIEIASDTYYPYAITDAAYQTAVKLMADICQRNGKTKLVWIKDSATALKYSDNGQQSNEMLITLHKWFASTACPGYYIESHLEDMVSQVNALLSGGEEYTVRQAAQLMIDENINGQDRIDWCDEHGLFASDVQTEIDLMLGKDTSAVITDLIGMLPVVQYGSTGDAVTFLQTELIRMGYLDAEADGACGVLTVTAIKALQSNWSKVYGNFGVDGCFGPKSWTKLLTGK